MRFVVVPAPQVTLVVSSYSLAIQSHFQRICRLLAENPYPSPQFGDIEEFRDSGGRQFYEFFDGILPVTLQYRVYASDVDEQRGLVWLARAIPAAGGRP